MKLVWQKNPFTVLDDLAKAVRNKICRKAVKQAAIEQTRDVKGLVPRRTGALKVAMGNRVKTYRESQITVGVIGAKSEYSRARPTDSKKLRQKTESQRTGFRHGMFGKLFRKVLFFFKKKSGRNKFIIRPHKYMPLVDKGTKYYRGRNFQRTAFNQARWEETCTRVVGEEMEKQVGN